MTYLSPITSISTSALELKSMNDHDFEIPIELEKYNYFFDKKIYV